jgi:hypothetical protein
MMRSIALFAKIFSESFNPLVEFSGVLGHSVAHLGLGVEGADYDQLLGLDDACAT